jgi:hypothetical protein
MIFNVNKNICRTASCGCDAGSDSTRARRNSTAAAEPRRAHLKRSARTSRTSPRCVGSKYLGAAQQSGRRTCFSRGAFRGAVQRDGGAGRTHVLRHQAQHSTLIVGGAAATALGYKKWTAAAPSCARTSISGKLPTPPEPCAGRELRVRKGRGETTAALALLPAYGIATERRPS